MSRVLLSFDNGKIFDFDGYEIKKGTYEYDDFPQPEVDFFGGLPMEIISYIFSFVISERTNCYELVRLDDFPKLRKKYPRGNWGFIGKIRSKFWPFVILNKRIRSSLIYDIEQILNKRKIFSLNSPLNWPKYDTYNDPLPHSFYLELTKFLEDFEKLKVEPYFEIKKKGHELCHKLRHIKWKSFRTNNSSQRAVTHKMAENYGYKHYTYSVTFREPGDYHHREEGWTSMTQCDGCSKCLEFRTKKCGVLITSEPVTQPKAINNKYVNELKKIFLE